MTKPRVHKPGEDDTTQLSIPVNRVPTNPIIEESPIDEEDTKKSRPINDVPVKPISDVDADTIPSPSKKRGKLNQQSSKNK